MIVLTRRGVLLGATALTAAGLWKPVIGRAETERTNHALLVAVTAYPNLRPEHALVGPNHDAALVREYLLGNAPVKFDAANVRVLADGAKDADGKLIADASPTLKNILDAIAAIDAKPGDFVYLHLSGHGSQQPTSDLESETDGMDEIFLPADVEFWSGDSKLMPNALVDDEIGSALDGLRGKGANVWIVIDACHSGTATRAADIGNQTMVMRKIEPKDLGVPDELINQGRAAQASRDLMEPISAPAKPGFAVSRSTKSNGKQTAPEGAQGKLIAFYAAQTVETTPEMPLPVGVANATSYGLFTYTIFQEMAKNPTQSYRQLGQAILQQYAAGGLQRPTPLFEGELDAPVFGADASERILQWPIVVSNGEATINAGLLHRLAPGSKLAILPTASALTDAAIGYIEVKAAKNLSSLVAPVAFDNKPQIKLDDMPSGAVARLTDVTVDFALIVARPGNVADLQHEVAMVHTVLDEIDANPKKKFQIKLVDAGQPADIRLVVMRENAIQGAAPDATDNPALWFLSATGDVEPNGKERPPLIQIDPLDPRKLAAHTAANLEKIFRAVSLARLGSAMSGGISRVSVDFSIRRVKPDTMEPLRASEVPVVNPRDEVHIVARNDSQDNIDINVLYIGSDYSITRMDAARLPPGNEMKKGLLYFSDKTFGMERMVAVLTAAPPLSAMEDLKYLEQGGVPAITRSTGKLKGLRAMLSDIGEVPGTRSALALSGPTSGSSEGAVMMFPLRTQRP